MDRETSKQLMLEQILKVRESELSTVFGWVIEEDDLDLFVSLRPRRQSDKLFLLRINFEEFSRRAPSFIFVDHETKEPSDTAWPPGVRHGSPPPGICTPGTHEFHEHFHKNDRQHPWSPDARSLLRTLAEVHRLMDRSF